jgi:hypothetical protein
LRQRIGDAKGEIVVLYDLAKVYEALGDTDATSSSIKMAAQKERALEPVRAGPSAERIG